MKITDVPNDAFNAEPTPVPTRVVPDWDALLKVLEVKGFVVLESDDLRITATGEEAPPVKNFNNFVRMNRRKKLFTKRITRTRWVCVLGE